MSPVMVNVNVLVNVVNVGECVKHLSVKIGEDIGKCMSTIVHDNGAVVQTTFFLVMRLKTTIVSSSDSLIVILVP